MQGLPLEVPVLEVGRESLLSWRRPNKFVIHESVEWTI